MSVVSEEWWYFIADVLDGYGWLLLRHFEICDEDGRLRMMLVSIGVLIIRFICAEVLHD